MTDSPVDLLKSFVAALQRNDRASANIAAFRLLELEAPLGDKWRSVAKVMHTNGELTAANRAMAFLAAQAGNAPQARFEQAAMAAQTGRLEEAWEIMATVPRDVPDRAGHEYILGTMAMNLGELDVAERHLEAALVSNPQLGQAMLALAASRKRGTHDDIGDRILAARGSLDEAPPLERSWFHYAAGRIHYDRREPASAFADFSAGARIAASLRPYDHAQDAAEATLSRLGYSREAVERVASQVDVDTSDAIFVTGLPRSGTTLVEQILVSHSAVGGGEELGRMGVLRRDIPENSLAGLEAYLAMRPAGELARLYLHLGRERFGDGLRYVDKALDSSRYIGLIAALLPQSPIVWLRRDPLDCAWSAFRTYFLRGLDWSWKLEDIAAHFRLEDELFAFWTELLPERILVVDYAELVSDPRPQIERLLAHCKLPIEPQVFEPHKTRRVVSTASVMQVREPINRSALGSAQAYAQWLAPFSDAYHGPQASS